MEGHPAQRGDQEPVPPLGHVPQEALPLRREPVAPGRRLHRRSAGLAHQQHGGGVVQHPRPLGGALEVGQQLGLGHHPQARRAPHREQVAAQAGAALVGQQGGDLVQAQHALPRVAPGGRPDERPDQVGRGGAQGAVEGRQVEAHHGGVQGHRRPAGEQPPQRPAGEGPEPPGQGRGGLVLQVARRRTSGAFGTRQRRRPGQERRRPPLRGRRRGRRRAAGADLPMGHSADEARDVGRDTVSPTSPEYGPHRQRLHRPRRLRPTRPRGRRPRLRLRPPGPDALLLLRPAGWPDGRRPAARLPRAGAGRTGQRPPGLARLIPAPGPAPGGRQERSGAVSTGAPSTGTGQRAAWGVGRGGRPARRPTPGATDLVPSGRCRWRRLPARGRPGGPGRGGGLPEAALGLVRRVRGGARGAQEHRAPAGGGVRLPAREARASGGCRCGRRRSTRPASARPGSAPTGAPAGSGRSARTSGASSVPNTNGHLGRVARARAPVPGRGAPGEQVGVGLRGVGGLQRGQAHRRHAEAPVAHDGDPEVGRRRALPPRCAGPPVRRDGLRGSNRAPSQASAVVRGSARRASRPASVRCAASGSRRRKNACSSRFVPTRRGTPAALPVATAASGSAGTAAPSATGP